MNEETNTDSLISIQECRKILKDYKSTDEEIENTRDDLQLLVELMFDKLFEEQKQKREQEK
jgi:hypothetical protein